jgi:hypothetical protein
MPSLRAAWLRRLLPRWRRHAPADLTILDQYVTEAPSPANAVNIFRGEWVSKLPGELGELTTGPVLPLFEDPRIDWAVEQLGGAAGKSVLEIGPLEGAHTTMLERHGTASIVAVEANTRAFLKCLIVKELLGLQRVRFLCGEAVEFLRANRGRFDLVFASGILYHLTNPVEFLELLARTTDRLFLWTHYYDPEIMPRLDETAMRFSAPASCEQAGFQHTLHRREYLDDIRGTRFFGGTALHCHWMERDEILAALRYFGFTDLRIGFEERENKGLGPSLAIAAVRE